MSAQDLAAIPIVLDACAFATRMHAGQQRKYTGEPYVLHCLEVAGMVGVLTEGDSELWQMARAEVERGVAKWLA